MLKVTELLHLMVEQDASDMFFSSGTPLHLKIDGVIMPLGENPLTGREVEQLATAMMSQEQRERFERRPEMNLGIDIEGKGRFRVNVFRQRGDVSMVIRYLRERIPTLEQLNLPLVLKELILKPRGLLLVVGATGSGKSTTIASMLEYLNENRRRHVLTVEDPIEYVHRYRKSIINQREIGIDTASYDDALVNAMREAPDVILIGEIRERKTMQHALAYAETGHLCLSTLHASNANHALERVVNFFPEEMRQQVLLDLAHNLTAIVSQRLVRDEQGKRLPAMEVMLITPLIRDLVQKGAIEEIREAMEKSGEPGMQTFDQSLFALYKAGRIDSKRALQHAESTSNLGVKIRLDKSSRA